MNRVSACDCDIVDSNVWVNGVEEFGDTVDEIKDSKSELEVG